MSDDHKVTATMFMEIKNNREKLDACPGHRFLLPDGFNELLANFGAFHVKVECSVCEGRMAVLDANEYTRGYEAAGGNPNDVIPGFKPDVKELYLRDAAINVVCNAVIGPDASMRDSTDCYHVPADDVDELRRSLSAR